MFVALVGPDGAGKTTVARQLAVLAEERGLAFRYVHWIPRWTAPQVDVAQPTGPPPPKRRAPARLTPSTKVLSVLRLLRNLVRFWTGYLLGMRRFVGPGRNRGSLVVADRWIYNYVGQPSSVAYHGPPGLARLAARLAPRPDVIAVLDAPAEVVVARKGELTVEEATSERLRWAELGAVLPTVVVDAVAAPDVVARAVLDALDARVDGVLR